MMFYEENSGNSNQASMPGIIAHPIQYPFFRNLLVPIQTAPLENTRNDLAVEALLSLRQQSSIVGQSSHAEFAIPVPILTAGTNYDGVKVKLVPKGKKRKSVDVSSSFNGNFNGNLSTQKTTRVSQRGNYKCSVCGTAKFKHVCVKPQADASVGTSIDPVNIDKIENFIIIKERTRTVSAYRGPVLPPPEVIDELCMRSRPLVSNTVILHPSAALLCEQGNPNFVSTAYTRVVYTNGFTPSYFRIPRHFDSDEGNNDSNTNTITTTSSNEKENDTDTEDHSAQRA